MTPKSLIAPARLARRPVLATQSDARLVDLVRAGYEPAFEAIVTRYRGALLRYAERFLPRERAEDAVQQSFVSAYEAILRDESALNLRPWLYRIAHNTSLNALRDRGLAARPARERIDGVERPGAGARAPQGLRDVVAAVQALPERQRDAIVLRELEGRWYDEIAAELGVTGGSVRQLLNRARNTLRAGATAVTPSACWCGFRGPRQPSRRRRGWRSCAGPPARAPWSGQGVRNGAGDRGGGGRRGGAADGRRRARCRAGAGGGGSRQRRSPRVERRHEGGLVGGGGSEGTRY